jgi:zinc/manganese transport system substrate-binding protein
MQSNRINKVILSITVIFVVLVILMIVTSSGSKQSSNSSKLQVVAAENFWGSLVSQVGGNKVNVDSIVSDPNADPHEYESNAADARNISGANYVIINGAGYDSWANKLLSASPNNARKVLTVANLVGVKEGNNPHLWYNPNYVNKTVKQMENDLINLDPHDKSYFQRQYAGTMNSLSTYQDRIKSIAKTFGGTKVGATEDIFGYLAHAADLDLISPPAFTEAVAEGNDPPASSVVEFEQQITASEPKVLVYNEQTVTPLTNTIKKLAADQNIPIVGVTETIQPPDTSFQVWMNSELINLENALNATKLGN